MVLGTTKHTLWLMLLPSSTQALEYCRRPRILLQTCDIGKLPASAAFDCAGLVVGVTQPDAGGALNLPVHRVLDWCRWALRVNHLLVCLCCLQHASVC